MCLYIAVTIIMLIHAGLAGSRLNLVLAVLTKPQLHQFKEDELMHAQMILPVQSNAESFSCHLCLLCTSGPYLFLVLICFVLDVDTSNLLA